MQVALEMVSDLVCPWCWLGLRRIRKAIDLADDVKVTLIFRPYELDPNIPKNGLDSKEYYAKRHSLSADRRRTMRDALLEQGKGDGIEFNFENISIRPNSFNAHRLVHWAQGQNKALEAKEALFQAYFSDQRDIGNSEVLVEIAGEIGLDKSIVRDLIDSDADVSRVREEESVFQRMGVYGVPTYIADRKLVVQGAQDSSQLAKFLRATAKDRPQERGSDHSGNAHIEK